MNDVQHEEAKSMLSVVENGRGKEDFEMEEEDFKKVPWFAVRHTQMLLVFFLVFIAFGMRVNLSVGIVAMTDPTVNPNVQTYNWTMKSTILSSFFWGYVLPQIGAGVIAETYGPKWCLAIAMSVSSLLGLLTPLLADVGPWAVMLCRMGQGFSQGFIFPSCHTMLSRWIPLEERSRIGTFAYAGGALGTVVAMPVTGLLAASSLGWPSAFYLYGSLGIVFAIVWSWIGANSPAEHKTISDEERMYIQKHCGQNLKSEEKDPIPWKEIAKSVPVWALIVVHCGQNWGFWTLLTQIPTYMSSILNYDIKENGFLSAAPYLALWVMSFFFSIMTDMIINKKMTSVTAARKIANGIGLCGPAIALFALGFVDGDQKKLAISLLIAAVGLNSATSSGFMVNHIDIAPSYSGTLMGITNCIANIAGIVAPLLVEFIVTDQKNIVQWRTIFLVASGIYIVTSLIFTLFGKAEVQYWDKAGYKNVEKSTENTDISNTEKPT